MGLRKIACATAYGPVPGGTENEPTTFLRRPRSGPAFGGFCFGDGGASLPTVMGPPGARGAVVISTPSAAVPPVTARYAMRLRTAPWPHQASPHGRSCAPGMACRSDGREITGKVYWGHLFACLLLDPPSMCMGNAFFHASCHRELIKRGIAGMLIIKALVVGSALMLLTSCAGYLTNYQTPCVQGHVCECVQYTTVNRSWLDCRDYGRVKSKAY